MPTVIDKNFIQNLCADAKGEKRKRAHHNFHQTTDDAVQRLLIALQPGTYVPVHRHTQSWKWESLLIVQGEVECLIFDGDGKLSARHQLSVDQTYGLEIPANTWHTIICKKDNSAIYELKPGPFDPQEAAEFCSWGPMEGDENVEQFQQWLRMASLGSVFTMT